MILYIQCLQDRVDDVTRSLILALGVCYHACLKSRPEYRKHIARFFHAPCQLPGGDEQIKEEIERWHFTYIFLYYIIILHLYILETLSQKHSLRLHFGSVGLRSLPLSLKIEKVYRSVIELDCGIVLLVANMKTWLGMSVKSRLIFLLFKVKNGYQ